MNAVKYLIIGNGVCGVTAAETIRRADGEANIVVVGRENKRLYSRVLLPSYVKGLTLRENLFLKTDTFWSDNNVQFLNDRTVSKIDDEACVAILDDGTPLQFEKALIATGGRSRRLGLLGEDLEGVHNLQTLEDADALVKTIQRLKSLPEYKQKVVIFGGGFISLEFADIFAQYGIGGIIVIRRPYYWEDRLDQESSDILVSALSQKGFRIYTDSTVKEILGTGIVEGVKLSNGEIYGCAAVGLGLGIELNTAFLAGSKIEVHDGGVGTDQFLQTSASNIFAAGDVAKFYNPLIGRRIHAGNWTNALLQGRLAGVNMASVVQEKTAVDFISSYGANHFGLSIVFVGAVAKDSETMVVRRGDAGWREQLFIRNNFFVGATIINRAKDRGAITNIIKNRGMITNPTELADPALSLDTYGTAL